MRTWSRTRRLATAALLALSFAPAHPVRATDAQAAAQEDAAASAARRYPPLPQGTITGTLVSVDARLNGVIVREESTGKQMAWRIDKAAVKELSSFKPGDKLFVIYRETGGGNRSITAIGFPGSAPKPLYRNATAASVQLISGPYVNGTCGGSREPADLHHRRMARGTGYEDDQPCWCCAPFGETCEPRNRAFEPGGDEVTGTIVLSRCFAGR
jgi:hypothetical protein